VRLRPTPSGPATVAPATATATPAAFPVDIPHKFGLTTIPAEPQRVVTVGWNDQDFALALGVIPVSTGEWFEEYPSYPWVTSALNGKELPTFSGIDFEAIAQQRPDLILAIYETIPQDVYDKLTRTAPTIVQSADFGDEETPWDVQTLTTGKALGRSEQAQALVDSVNAKIDEAKAAHPEFAGKVLVADFGPENGGHYLLAAGDPRRALFDALGFRGPGGAGRDQRGAGRPAQLGRAVRQRRVEGDDARLADILGAGRGEVRPDAVHDLRDTAVRRARLQRTERAALALDVLVPQLGAATDNDPGTPWRTCRTRPEPARSGVDPLRPAGCAARRAGLTPDRGPRRWRSIWYATRAGAAWPRTPG
jgi:iron complex transport system substrate-binding protein